MRTDTSSCRRGAKPTTLVVALALSVMGCDGVPWVDLDVDGPRKTSEAGESVDVAVTLLRRPREVVTVTARSSDETEGTVEGTLQFDGANWQTPQVLTVTGVDDDSQDGDQRYTIKVLGRSASHKHAVLVGVLHFVNQDDDAPAFAGLGDLAGGDTVSEAWDVSDSGDVVVGWSRDADGDRAFRWTPGQGLEALEGIGGRAYGVSPDGNWISGSLAEPGPDDLTDRTAARWTAGSPPERLSTPPEIPSENRYFGYWFVEGYAVRNDGIVFGTCLQGGAYGDPIACRTGPETFAWGSYVRAVDADGNWAGELLPSKSYPFADAMFNGSRVPYPASGECIIPHDCSAIAWDFVDAGEFIVGTSVMKETESAWIREHDEETTVLTPLSEDNPASGSGAYTLSGDARLIGGFSTDSEGEVHAVLWVDGIVTTLADFMATAGVVIPAGWQLLEVRELTPDGRVAVGNGVNPQGYPEAFRVVLPTQF